MEKKMSTWIRVAGNATKIKANDSHGWRCFVAGGPEIALTSWSLSGVASSQNVIAGINAKGDANGLVAWIDCFGTYTIEDGVLQIQLEEPL